MPYCATADFVGAGSRISEILCDQAQKTWHNSGFSFPLMKFLPTLCCLYSVLMLAPSLRASAFPATGPTVPGRVAKLENGVAYAPAEAPRSVQRAIWAANQLRSKPYRYGGGHASFTDSGYDCSGTVSYALGAAGVVKSPLSSSGFRLFGAKGQGRWITVYARNGHTFAVIAGLRLDTTPYNNWRGRWAPRWQSNYRHPAGFVARHPNGL